MKFLRSSVIADYNGRSANRELEVLMKKHIAEFEKEHDKITFDSPSHHISEGGAVSRSTFISNTPFLLIRFPQPHF